jgi:GGDEF domain-containing protein
LWSQGVALKDFTAYAKATTERIANNARKLAKSIAERDGITQGIICLISAVESCWSFQVRRRYRTGRVELFRRERKCLRHYLYLIDDELGVHAVRIQGWIPYECQIYINGREWLARQLDKRGIGYVRWDNSLLAVDDLDTAARLSDRFAHKAWPRVLNAFARRLNPLLGAIGAAG